MGQCLSGRGDAAGEPVVAATATTATVPTARPAPPAAGAGAATSGSPAPPPAAAPAAAAYILRQGSTGPELAVSHTAATSGQGSPRSVVVAVGAVPTVPVTPALIVASTPEALIGDIRVLEHICSGSFAVVYKALYQGADTAVKVMLADGLDKACQREILVAPQLSHPNVIKTYLTRYAVLTKAFLENLRDVERLLQQQQQQPKQAQATAAAQQAQAAEKLLQGAYANFPSGDGFGLPRAKGHPEQGWRKVFQHLVAQPGKLVIVSVQEMASGGTLVGAIRKGIFRTEGGLWQPRIARRALLRTAAEVCRGMMHLHSRAVLHGDLKPANVLLVKSREDVRGFSAKISDFGLSHLLGTRSRINTETLGTVAYMAPESFMEQLCRASDVYSFGMLLNEMMTGIRAYEDMAHTQVMLGVASEGLRPTWPDAEWPELCALGRRCLQQSPAARPTFGEVEEELVLQEAAVRAQWLAEVAALTTSGSSGNSAYRSRRRAAEPDGSRSGMRFSVEGSSGAPNARRSGDLSSGTRSGQPDSDGQQQQQQQAQWQVQQRLPTSVSVRLQQQQAQAQQQAQPHAQAQVQQASADAFGQQQEQQAQPPAQEQQQQADADASVQQQQQQHAQPQAQQQQQQQQASPFAYVQQQQQVSANASAQQQPLDLQQQQQTSADGRPQQVPASQFPSTAVPAPAPA